MTYAECARTVGGQPVYDPAIFFPTSTTQGAEAMRTKAAQACRICPIAQACFVDALERGEHGGIWGGVDFTLMRDRASRPGSPDHGTRWQTLARRSRRLATLEPGEAQSREAKRAHDAARNRRKRDEVVS